MKKSLYIFILLICTTTGTKTQLVVGDPNATTGNTFSFDIGFMSYDEKTDTSPARWWVATNDTDIATLPAETQQYGLSFVIKAASYLTPGTVIQATPMATPGNAAVFSWNGSAVTQTSVPNPIYGGVFTNFLVSNHKPVFTVAASPNILYSVQDIKLYAQETETNVNSTQLLALDFDAYTGVNGQEIAAIQGFIDTIYTAYANGVFGTATSKITVAARQAGPNENNQAQQYLKPLATTPITISTNALKGGVSNPDVASFGPFVSIKNALFLTYVTLQATADTGPACGIMLTQLSSNNSVLDFEQLAPSAVLNATGIDTVVSAAAGNTIRITDAAGMATSTNLQYIIVARDTGTGPQTVYAVPIVSTGIFKGTIADYTVIKTNFGIKPPVFISRNFTTVVSDVSQIDIANADVQAQITVGGGLPPLASGNINKLFVVGDSVYVVLGGEYDTNQQPGTFRSQAIFAADGHIISWTPWSRVFGSDLQMVYGYVDTNSLVGCYAAATTPSSTPSYQAIFETIFNNSSNFSPMFVQLPYTLGGTQGLFNFGQTTPGFNDAISLLVATSLNRVVIGQTGAINSATEFGVLTMSDGDVLVFTGEAINNQQAIVAAEMAHNGSNHWLFVGGVSGVSVLTYDVAGYTWAGNLLNIVGLDAGQTWKTVGNFSMVKKLVWDSTYLYVLTNSAIYRIFLDPNAFKAEPTTTLSVETIVVAKNISPNLSFLDIIVDSGYALIGTTNGLYKWMSGVLSTVDVPGGLPAISKLIAIAPSQTPQNDFLTLSNLLVLSNSFGTQQARLSRFVLQNGAITPLPDTIVTQYNQPTVGQPGPFIVFNNYISNYFSDGSWNVANSYFLGVNQPQNITATPFLQQISSNVRSGLSSSQVIMPQYSNYAPLPFISMGANNLALLRESTSGAVISAGEFQAYTNA